MSAQPTATLRRVDLDGRDVALRYMRSEDAQAMLTFVRSVPTHDLMFLPTDITEIEGLNSWIDDILMGYAGVILAEDADGIVGFGSVVRASTSWSRHVAEIRVVVGEPARGHGLGRQLTAEAFRVAADLGVRRVVAQMTLDQIAAIRVFRRLGFVPLAVLADQVIDTDGTTYDLLVMHQDVESFEDTLSHLAE
jgi:RimJ/RimL family protein N-acetyltransferase